MRMHAVCAMVLTCAWGATASAGAPERFAVSFEGGYQGFSSAGDSAKAVFDGSTGTSTLGGSVRFGLTRSLFAGAGVRVMKKEGERVFVEGPGSTVFRLGHPLEVRLVPVYGFVGWRFMPESSLVPYLSAGGGFTSYSEESTVGGLTESESFSKATWHVAAGADYAIGAFGIGFEARFTSVPNVIGLGGVSKIYGETDLGGFSVVGRVSFRR